MLAKHAFTLTSFFKYLLKNMNMIWVDTDQKRTRFSAMHILMYFIHISSALLKCKAICVLKVSNNDLIAPPLHDSTIKLFNW